MTFQLSYRQFSVLACGTVVCLALSLLFNISSAAAEDFNPGHIIDDTVFTNANTLNASQIQDFLNSKVTSCDTNGTQSASDFGRSDLTHAQYAASRGWQAPPYTCLRNFSEGGKSAAQIIYDTAQKYQINPQVLIVLLQKEQGLVTDTWPLNSQYRTATGYGCPDTAPCDSQYYGLTNQVDWSGKMFRAIMNASPTWYTPYILGNNYIQYNPSSSCGGSYVNIENRSTQALYNYTPYQPNAAALAAPMGTTVTCGAYGNLNFFRYFLSWFGSPTGTDNGSVSIKNRYNQLGGEKSTLGKSVGFVVCGIRNNGCYQNYQNGAILWSQSTGAWENYGVIRDRYREMGYENGILGLPIGAIVCGIKDNGCFQNYESGAIVWSARSGAHESYGGIRLRWQQFGVENGGLGYPTSNVVCGLKDGGCYQNYQVGAILWSPASGAWESYGAIRTRYGQTGFENGVLGYPISYPVCGIRNGGCYQNYQNGAILWSPASGAWENYGAIRTRYTALGFENSGIGYPIGPIVCGLKDGGCYQNYQIGAILWSNASGAWENYGPIRDRYRQLGFENGILGYPTGPYNTYMSTGISQTYQGGTLTQLPSQAVQLQ